MTTDFYLWSIAIGSTLLTLVGLYTGWRSFRVFLLRLELLSIRNQLWDEACELGCLSDPAYRAYRRNLNLMVRYAHKIDLVSLALSSRSPDKDSDLGTCADPEMQRAMDRALASTVRCMNNYMLWHRPFTGVMLLWVLGGAARLMRLASYFGQFSFGVLKSSAAQIRSFGRTPDVSTQQWLAHNGPAVFSGR